MNERFFLFGFFLWSIKTTDAAVPAAPKQAYGICIDITLCQQPPYHSLCSQGLPICPSPTVHSTTRLIPPGPPGPSVSTINTHAGTTPLPTTTINKLITTPGVNTKTNTPPSVTKTPSKPTTVIVKNTHIALSGKQVNVLTIQNNFKISLGGKKSNIRQPGTS